MSFLSLKPKKNYFWKGNNITSHLPSRENPLLRAVFAHCPPALSPSPRALSRSQISRPASEILYRYSIYLTWKMNLIWSTRPLKGKMSYLTRP